MDFLSGLVSQVTGGIDAAFDSSFDTGIPELNEIISKDISNQCCADCDKSDPRWVQLDRSIFLCTRCAGIHGMLSGDPSCVTSLRVVTEKSVISSVHLKALRAGGNASSNKRLLDKLKKGPPGGFRYDLAKMKPDDTAGICYLIESKYQYADASSPAAPPSFAPPVKVQRSPVGTWGSPREAPVPQPLEPVLQTVPRDRQESIDLLSMIPPKSPDLASQLLDSPVQQQAINAQVMNAFSAPAQNQPAARLPYQQPAMMAPQNQPAFSQSPFVVQQGRQPQMPSATIGGQVYGQQQPNLALGAVARYPQQPMQQQAGYPQPMQQQGGYQSPQQPMQQQAPNRVSPFYNPGMHNNC